MLMLQLIIQLFIEGRLIRYHLLIENVAVAPARQGRGLERVVVLTDDRRIQEAVEAFGGECEMTPADCRTGTDRIAWAARKWAATGIVNVQGDEPLLDPDTVSAIATHLIESPEDPMVTFASTGRPEDLANPDLVKVVVDRSGRALYFSRAGVPFSRGGEPGPVLCHVGLYGYQREALLELADLDSTPLEISESLEQLRAPEHGMTIRVLHTDHRAIGVDTEEDLCRVEEMILAAERDGGR